MDSAKEIMDKVQLDSKTSLPISDDPQKPCPHGLMVTEYEDGSLATWQCSKCVKEEETKRKERETAERKLDAFRQTIQDMKPHTSIPKRFRGKTLENYQGDSKQKQTVLNLCKKYVGSFKSVLENGTSMVFCGKPGTGKTHLAYAIMSALHQHQYTVAVTTAADMTAEIKSGYKSEFADVTPASITLKFASLDLLIIDEVGVQVASDAEKRIFFDVINKRYSEMLPTMLISNLELSELSKFVGERVIDRMKENRGVVFAFDWDSFRR